MDFDCPHGYAFLGTAPSRVLAFWAILDLIHRDRGQVSEMMTTNIINLLCSIPPFILILFYNY